MNQYKIAVTRTYVVFVDAEDEEIALEQAMDSAEEFTNGIYDESEAKVLDSWETTRTMTAEFEQDVEYDARTILRELFTPAVRDRMWDTLGRDIIEDVYTSSAYQDTGEFNRDDVKLAITRTICRELGLEDLA